jgi:prepilin-type N-terminal cleavage/methylation domain-containing protein
MRRRGGFTLIEVLVALVLVASMAAAVASLASTNANVVARAREADREARDASAFLDMVALWPREDLDRHLGEHEQGAWRLRVAHPAPSLYTATLLDSSGRRPLLATALYRPDSPATEARDAAP